MDAVWQVDTLEVGLLEQADLVDKVFLVEASATHKGVGSPGSSNSLFQMRKLLVWDRVKLTERFQFVNFDKVVWDVGWCGMWENVV